MPPLSEERIWLPKKKLLLRVEDSAKTFFYPCLWSVIAVVRE